MGIKSIEAQGFRFFRSLLLTWGWDHREPSERPLDQHCHRFPQFPLPLGNVCATCRRRAATLRWLFPRSQRIFPQTQMSGAPRFFDCANGLLVCRQFMANERSGLWRCLAVVRLEACPDPPRARSATSPVSSKLWRPFSARRCPQPSVVLGHPRGNKPLSRLSRSAGSACHEPFTEGNHIHLRVQAGVEAAVAVVDAGGGIP